MRKDKTIRNAVYSLAIAASLAGCGNVNRSQVGAVLGGADGAYICASVMGMNEYFTAAGAVTGAMIGANVLYNSDHDSHNATFVDHLNTSPNTPSYSNWYNPYTSNRGIIKTTKSYYINGIKCSDYSSYRDISTRWPLIGAHRQQNIEFGSACQMPDGKWIEKPDHIRVSGNDVEWAALVPKGIPGEGNSIESLCYSDGDYWNKPIKTRGKERDKELKLRYGRDFTGLCDGW